MIRSIRYQAFLRVSVAGLCFVTLSMFAQEFSAEYMLESTYVGESDVTRGHQTVENFDEHNAVARFILTPRIEAGVLRIGADYERFSFGFPALTPLPNTLQSADLVLGLDTQFSDSVVARFEAQPGVYGTNHFDIDSFNVPFVAGATYIYNSNLQLVLGVSVDIERKYAVLPGGGFRWKLHRQWVLDAVLPKPRLEYNPNENVELYFGANIKETNFRVDDHFGDTHGTPGVNNRVSRLNNAVLTYSEIRTGIGVDWKVSSHATLTAEAGYQPYRTFDFYRADLRFHEDGSAPYGMISLHGAF